MSCCDKHAIWESFIVKNTFGYWKKHHFHKQNNSFLYPKLPFHHAGDNVSRPKR